ncbi:hypothetical protein GCM10009836_66630 [Pseudonocardia ailaonensis]|uniref:Aminoglycoside phosphotransferase domain-containing protein n=1 Tax=Pseudonocardia ailaonensis TaxID=367279 RepID=A0ABN2NPW5_9PSEU
MFARIRAEGLAAAVEVAGRLGLAGEPEVLSERGNLLVRFGAVVARVATLTAHTRRHPEEWLARELAVATRVARRGGPVVAPLAEAGPHRAGGYVLTLWEYVEILPDRPDPETAGRALARLHAAAAGVPGLPWLAAADRQTAEALERVPGAPAWLREEHAAVLAELRGSEPVVLHGDAHAGNLLLTPRGPLWTDLEETSLGPPEWDLATLAGSRFGPDRTGRNPAPDRDPPGPPADRTPADRTSAEREPADRRPDERTPVEPPVVGTPVVGTPARRALAAWAAESGRPLPTPEQFAPFRRARELEGLAWLLAMAEVHPDRYRPLADRALAEREPPPRPR